MAKTAVIIQCHSVGWEGGPDVSLLRTPSGILVIEEVIRRAKQLNQTEGVPIIACPDVPENDVFVEIADRAGVRCYKGSTSNVLNRLLSASRLVGADQFVWLQGIHFLLDVAMMDEMTEWTLSNGYDYVRVPDGSCKLTLGQIVAVKALKRSIDLITHLTAKDQALYSARPLAYMRTRPDVFRIGLYEQLPRYNDDTLRELRRIASMTLLQERAFHTELACSVGDASLGRYRDILSLIESEASILDIASGAGYGSQLLAKKARSVVGVDLSSEAIDFARLHHGESAEFRLGAAEKIPARDGDFDTVVGIATIEHVKDDNTFVREMARVLKPRGRAIIYTPQNRMGKIPVWPWHEREYSIESLKSLVAPAFIVERVVGWQNGALTVDDERGDGMFLIARRLG